MSTRACTQREPRPYIRGLGSRLLGDLASRQEGEDSKDIVKRNLRAGANRFVRKMQGSGRAKKSKKKAGKARSQAGSGTQANKKKRRSAPTRQSRAVVSRERKKKKKPVSFRPDIFG